MNVLRYLAVVAAMLFQCSCDKAAEAPAEPVDLVVAAQTWNTVDKTWGDEELHQLANGRILYKKRCAGCHLSSGEGQLTLGAPALENSSVVAGAVDGLVTTVLSGRGSMPAFRQSITDADLAAILSYVSNAWGNNRGDVVTVPDVTAVRNSAE
jgi:mono/diheme cytochrome c family protein